MPQTNCRGVAPSNQQPRWPEGYLTVLREAETQKKNHPALCGLGPPVLCKASGPQAPGLGPG